MNEIKTYSRSAKIKKIPDPITEAHQQISFKMNTQTYSTKKIKTYGPSAKIKKIPDSIDFPLTDGGPKIDVDVTEAHGSTPRALDLPLTDEGPKIDVDVTEVDGSTPRALNGASRNYHIVDLKYIVKRSTEVFLFLLSIIYEVNMNLDLLSEIF
jgi:hypothetical protein